MVSINEALGKTIARERKKRGLSQEEFALMIGIGQKYLSDVELGKRNVSLLFAKRVADGFGFSIYELFELIEKERHFMIINKRHDV